MVAKLMKHELRAIMRVLVFIGIACIVWAVVGRLLLFSKNAPILSGIFIAGAVCLAVFTCVAAYVLSVARFARSLYTGEGYLTLSLPVTSMQLLISKLLSAIIAMVFGVAVAIVSCTILCTGIPAQVWDAIKELLREFLPALQAYISSDPMIVVDYVIMFLVELPMLLLMLFLFISVGQLFNKHRKLITFGIAVGTMLVAFPVLNTYCFMPILNAANRVNVHLSNWIEIIVYLAVDIGCFFLVRFILTHKVNLIG